MEIFWAAGVLTLFLTNTFALGNEQPQGTKAADNYQPPGCLLGKNEKGPILQKCTLSSGPFHMYCDVVPRAQAEQTCAENGWRLASVTDENLIFAEDLMSKCSFNGFAWIAAYNGLQSEPFVYLRPQMVVFDGDWLAREYTMQPMCEDVPVISETTTESTTITTFVDTSYTATTTYTTLYKTHDESNEKRAKVCSPLTGCGNPCAGQTPWRDCNSCACADVCPQSYDGLHIVALAYPTYKDAVAACARKGWRLADLTSGMVGAVESNIWKPCFASRRRQRNDTYFARSYNGVTGSCVVASIQSIGYRVSIGTDDAFCNDDNSGEELGGYALCQENCQYWPTGMGPYEGTETTTTLTVRSTSLVSTPATTVTTTETVTCSKCYRRHRHSPGHEDSF